MRMSDTEAAAYYDRHRDDATVWGPAEPADGGTHVRRGTIVSVRLGEAEVEALRAAATARRMALSEFVRVAALETAGARSPIDTEAVADELERVVRTLRAAR